METTPKDILFDISYYTDVAANVGNRSLLPFSANQLSAPKWILGSTFLFSINEL